MKIEKKSINQHQVELTVRVPKSDVQAQLNHAAAHLSEHRPIKGFRPGKAPFDVVKREFGEAAIVSEALEDIINETFAQALEQENLTTYGKINFDLLPVVSDDEVAAYKAAVTVMPTVKLGNWESKKLKREEVKVTDEELTRALDELGAMTTKEEAVDRAVEQNDKAVIDFEVAVDGKVIDGGTAQDFGLVIGEGKMIPGFEEKVIGAKSGEKLEFELNFPDKYHATNLSGKPAKFKVTVKQVLARIKPTIDDEFAKRLGMESLQALKDRLSLNIKQEKQDKEEERLEIAAIKQLTDSAEFSPLPDVMIADTVQDVIHDFEHTLAHQGMKFDQYLSSIGKTLDQLKKDFEPRALERIKSSMALGQLAEEQKINITTEEIEEELAIQKISHKNNQQALNDIAQPEYRRHVANSLINRKLIKFLKDKLIE